MPDDFDKAASRDAMEKFARLLATAQRPVFLYAMSLLHHAADAEEVLQETNLILWRKFHEFAPGSDFVCWARSIARYEVLRFRRRKQRTAIPFSDAFLETLAERVDRDADAWDQRRRALGRCLDKLSGKDRDLVVRRYQQQVPTTELANAMGRSRQGTRRSLQRIRSALLDCVERKVAAEERA